MLTDFLTPSTPSPQLLTSRDTGVWFFECANCGTDACVVNLDSLSQAFLIAKQAGWKHTIGGQELVCPDCIDNGSMLFWTKGKLG